MLKVKNIFDVIFWKFIFVGFINTLFGTTIMFVFYNVFHLSYWISSASNYILGSILSYILNRYFTFNSKKRVSHTILFFTLNIVMCFFLAYGMAKPLVRYFLQDFSSNIQENIAMFIGMCFFVFLNYIGQRFWVFKIAEKT